MDLTPHHGPDAERVRPDDLPSSVRAAIAILQADGPEPDGAFGERARWALGVLYERYHGLAWLTAARILGSRADVEDVVEDVFFELRATVRRYRPGNFPGWLRQVVHCAALMRLRAQGRQREQCLDGVPDLGDGQVLDADFIALEDAAAVRRALDCLPDSLRSVVMLRVYDGHSHREVAAQLGITEGASGVRWSRAIARLREILRD